MLKLGEVIFGMLELGKLVVVSFGKLKLGKLGGILLSNLFKTCLVTLY